MPDNPGEKAPVQVPPNVAGDISVAASAHAPFLYFDTVTNFGCSGGIVNATLEAIRYTAIRGEVVAERVVVAHLRTGLGGAKALAEALKAAQLIAQPPASGSTN